MNVVGCKAQCDKKPFRKLAFCLHTVIMVELPCSAFWWQSLSCLHKPSKSSAALGVSPLRPGLLILHSLLKTQPAAL